jgi:hypothetical protein
MIVMVIHTILARSAPVHELDCNLEGCVAVSHPVVFFEAEEVEKHLL